MKKSNLILLTIALLALANSLYAQQAGKRISHTTVAIFNNSDKDVNIKLGLIRNDLYAYLIRSQEKWISPTFPLNSRPLLIVKTNTIEKKYTLQLNKTYMIFWNNKKKYWDITKVKN